MSEVPDGAQLSDDGNWWWDGEQWQPVSGGEAGSAESNVADAAASAERAFEAAWGAEIAKLKRMFSEHRYGCWCGPGHTCEEEQDDMDKCCHQHDLGYAAAGVTSADPPGGGEVGMWTVEGFKRTIGADAELFACITATAVDTHFYGPEAALYRAGVELIFGSRATIAAWLIANGY